ncbi:hypothetical protein [Nocardia acidivorans]|uniref:hypothetical protein n=1 Tax=Nocardia acidivorans TaxID=404580 RepID=UPI001C3F7901|nr:hypothetical protein [Nocardia acidivorans]
MFNRSLSEDAAYIKSFAEQIDGPVLLAGCSFGGAVIAVAGVTDNVTGLVYVSGYALDEGEFWVNRKAVSPIPNWPPRLGQVSGGGW